MKLALIIQLVNTCLAVSNKKLAGKINQVMTASLKNGPALKNFKLQTIYVLAYNP
jgi:hypothetical protein